MNEVLNRTCVFQTFSIFDDESLFLPLLDAAAVLVVRYQLVHVVRKLLLHLEHVTNVNYMVINYVHYMVINLLNLEVVNY